MKYVQLPAAHRARRPEIVSAELRCERAVDEVVGSLNGEMDAVLLAFAEWMELIQKSCDEHGIDSGIVGDPAYNRARAAGLLAG